MAFAQIKEDTLQPEINTWWGNLPEEKQKEWWEEGDYYYTTDPSKTYILAYLIPMTFGVSGVTVIPFNNMGIRHRREDITPAPCAAFWWKLERHLEKEHLIRITIYGREVGYNYEITPHRTGEVLGQWDNDDRRHALINAAIAVQEGGEG